MKRHRTDGLSLAFGLVFLLAVGWWLFGRTVDIALPQLGWFVAGALIVFGVVGLLGALRSDRGRGEDQAGDGRPADQAGDWAADGRPGDRAADGRPGDRADDRIPTDDEVS